MSISMYQVAVPVCIRALGNLVHVLKKGEQVNIIGEQDEYYQIKPPADAFLYVDQKYVDPVRQLKKPEMLPASPPAGAPTAEPVAATETMRSS